MKKKLASLIAFALALVMAMTSLPVWTVWAVSTEDGETATVKATIENDSSVYTEPYADAADASFGLRTYSRTMDEVRAWLDNEAAMQNQYNNGQCTWFCNHYLVDFWGENGIYGVGNANGWVGHCPPNWQNVNVGGNPDNFRMGDLIVEYIPDRNGHVMVYYGKGSDGRHYVVDQNFNGHLYTTKHIWYTPLANTTYCYRPPISTAPQPSKPVIVEAVTCSKTWFQWNPCTNTVQYDVRIYHNGASEAFITEYAVPSTYYYSRQLDNGTYQIDVSAVNIVNGEVVWTTSDRRTFTVNNKTEFVPSHTEEWNGHTYLLYDYDFASWIEAKDFCEQNGGHLATITSSEENSFINGMLQNSNQEFCWLGGSRLNSSSWRWVTDETFGYSNWLDGQPDNYLGIEHYIGMWRGDGKWNDFTTVRSGGCLILEKDYIETSGDVNGDGFVTIADALLILRYSMGLVLLDNSQYADINGDGSISVLDALLVLRYAMGSI